ncbi:MAG: TolC family protein, partial [Bacteroidales bacterium]|nr:TolC family protein [Bacteroidales bacterium]
LFDLNLLCGINDTDNVDLEEVNFKINADTISYSKFINKFKLDSLNIITKQKVFDRNYKPKLSLFANAGLNAVYVPAVNRLGFATGINFTWNIFDGNQKTIQHKKSFIEIETIEFEKQNFVNKYNTRKAKFLNQIKTIDKQINIVQNQLTEYEKLFKLYQMELSQAQISIMDFKNLIRDISEKKQENLHLQMQKQIFINSYNYWNF